MQRDLTFFELLHMFSRTLHVTRQLITSMWLSHLR